MEILRDLNFNGNSQLKINNSASVILIALAISCFITSCSKKPGELYNDGLKSFASGDYAKAQENFADGIKKNGSDSLYAGFIAANLVTGKYAPVNSAYNDFTDGIHSLLVKMYGERPMKMVGATTRIIPYKIEGGNQLPPDFPQTVEIQAIADRQGFFFLKQQIDKIVKK